MTATTVQKVKRGSTRQRCFVRLEVIRKLRPQPLLK